MDREPHPTRTAGRPTSGRGGGAGGGDKVNAAFEFGYQNGGGRDEGLALLAETVSNLAGGLKFNGAAIVNFNGFQSLVTAIGGCICVSTSASVHIGYTMRTGRGEPCNFDPNGIPTTLKPNMRPQVDEFACYDFAASQALDCVRRRDKLANNVGDYGRQRHQQQFIKAMRTKATSAGVITNPLKVNGVLNSVGQAVSFYNNNVSLADWIFTLKGIKPSQLVTFMVNNGQFHSEIINGQTYEFLDDASKALLSAAHPEILNNDASRVPTLPSGTPPQHAATPTKKHAR